MQTKETSKVKNTFSIIFYIRRDKLKKNGTVPIFSRITVAGTTTNFNIHTDVNLKLWDAKASRATGKTPEAKEVNLILDTYISNINDTYKDLIQRDGSTDAETVKNVLLGISDANSKPMYLLDLFKEHNEEMKSLIGKSCSPAIYQKYECVYKKIQNFIKEKYNMSDIKLVSIRHQFIVDFETYMRIHDNNGTNTVGRNMRLLKKIINRALNNGYITANPFANYTIKFEKTDRGYLTEAELQKIIDKEFKVERLEKVKDIFLFSCFTGLAYIDVESLTYEDLDKGIDNYLWIMNKRIKTGTDVTVPLMDIPLKLVEKYRNKQGNKVFPSMSNYRLNAYLKETADI